MTLLHDAVEQKKWDVRMQERNLRRELYKQDELDKKTEQLPDDADNAEAVTLQSLEEQSSRKPVAKYTNGTR